MATTASLILSVSGGTIEAIDIHGAVVREPEACSFVNKQSIPDVVAAARKAFDASHVFLIGPSARTALSNWFFRSVLLSAPVTALLSAVFHAVGVRTYRCGDGPTNFWGSAAAAITVAVATQSVGWYLLIRHLFLDHLATDDGPLVHPEYFSHEGGASEEKGRQYLFAAAVPISSKDSDATEKSWDIVGSTVLLTGKIADGSHHPLVTDIFAGKPLGIIRTVGVAPEHHGSGLGGRMLRAAIAKAREIGLKELVLCTTVAMVSARGMYEKYGFQLEKQHTEMAAIGYNLFMYRKKL